MNCPRLLEFQESLANGQRTPALSDWRPATAAASNLEVVSLGAVPEARTINRCRRKRQGPNFSDTRGMGPNKDRRDSHGSIRQAHLPDAQSEGGAGPTTEWDKYCKRDVPAPCLNQRKRGLSKQPQARRREWIYSWRETPSVCDGDGL